MITGANTNVRHRGMIFHVQTEDSGRANPHIISHVYHHGTILASEKTRYADRIEAEDLESVVRGLIETQHKSMLARLKAGSFDAVIDDRLGSTGSSTDGIEMSTPVPVDEDEGRPEAPAPSPPSPPPAAAAPRGFGEGIVSQKPLDEVILEYLAEKARDRAADRAGKSAQKSRTSG
jgi:hypothetical protein